MIKIGMIFFCLSTVIAYSGEDNVRIILENGYYYTQIENGQKYQIVAQQNWPPNEVSLSPQGKYAAYTTGNGLGFDNAGVDLYYCNVDGSERTFLHKFEDYARSLSWVSMDNRDFILVALMDCRYVYGGIQVLDVKSKNVILTTLGDSLSKIEGKDCYRIYCYGQPVEKGKRMICLDELLHLQAQDSSNISYFTDLTSGDIYSSTQSEPVLKLNSLSELSKGLGKDFGKFLEGRNFYISYVIPTHQNRRILFIGEASTLGLFGVFDLNEKRLLSLDYSDEQRFLNASWSPDGSRIAVIRLSNWQNYIDFYKIDEEGKVNLIRTKSLPGDGQVTDFKWSSDSNTVYFLYVSSGSQNVRYIIDVEDK
ncbi:MAG TPA: hypothetical protein VMT04_10865 [Terriglobales bacterium]|nr:hypothetical protein [Terriglobales bacterium]